MQAEGKAQGLLSPPASAGREGDGALGASLISGRKRERENMATPELRLPENVSGTFFVTRECTDCGLCPELAPSVFKHHEGFSIVYHQPESAEEREQAIEAKDGCPVEAIGCEEG